MSFFYFVELLSNNGDVQQRHKFTDLPVRLGRSYNNDIILDDHHTAGEHAVIEINEHGNLVIHIHKFNSLAILSFSLDTPTFACATAIMWLALK